MNQNNRRPDQFGGHRAPQGPAPDFFREKFFVDGRLNPNWVSENAQELSRWITQGGHAMGATAMRNFYNEFLRIKGMPASRADEKLIQIKLLRAKTNYKHKVQQAGNLHPEFVKFINKLLDEIGNEVAKFDDACFVFEALIGYADKR